MAHPRFQTIDTHDFSDGDLLAFDATVSKFGPHGGQIRTGEGVPDDALGTDGDFYLDSTSGDYFKKEAGAWVQKGNLQGPEGEGGSAALATPSNGTGNPGTNGSVTGLDKRTLNAIHAPVNPGTVGGIIKYWEIYDANGAFVGWSPIYGLATAP